jgi:hypothetical protein
LTRQLCLLLLLLLLLLLPALQVTFVAELTDPACLADTARFKRILKNFCGGKKKGAGGGRHV